MSSLLADKKTSGKIRLNYERNKKQDQTENIDLAAKAFSYADCRGEYWNPEEFSLLWGTPLWNQASESQRILLNQLYWVAYYSQIISAEIATIFFNQTSAAGLYAMEDFRTICDMLDLETSQERAHIAAFQKVAREVEDTLFDERLFSYPMRSPYAETMTFADSNTIKRFWKWIQLNAFGLLSSGNAFIASQYFGIRGIRTLNGKIVQHQLSQYYVNHPDQDNAPIPSKISYYHFLDESYHFNSSTIVSHDVIKHLKPPTAFERQVANLAVKGCQKDHYNFSVILNGIFWYDPAAYRAIYRVFRSSAFGMDDADAREMIRKCFTQDSDGLQASYKTHRTATESYRAYVSDLDYVNAANKSMGLMAKNDIGKYLKTANRRFLRFQPA
jgi:hypothetical protein